MSLPSVPADLNALSDEQLAQLDAELTRAQQPAPPKEPTVDEVIAGLSPMRRNELANAQPEAVQAVIDQHKSFVARHAAGENPLDSGDREFWKWTQLTGRNKGPGAWETLKQGYWGMGGDLGMAAYESFDLLTTPGAAPSEIDVEKQKRGGALAIDTAAQVGLNAAVMKRGAGQALDWASTKIAEAFVSDPVGRDMLEEQSLDKGFEVALANHRDAQTAENFHQKLVGFLPSVAEAYGDVEIDPAAARGLAIPADPGNFAGLAAARVATRLGTVPIIGEIQAGIKAVGRQRAVVEEAKTVLDAATARASAGDVAWLRESGTTISNLRAQVAEAVKKVEEVEAASKQSVDEAVKKVEEVQQAAATRRAAGRAAQGAGTFVEGVGKVADAVGHLPEYIASKIAPENQWLKFKLADAVTGAGLYAAGEVTDNDAIKAAGVVVGAAPLVRAIGKDTRLLGELYAQGQTVLPFWKQVRKIPEVSGLTKQAGAFLDNQFVNASARVAGSTVKGAVAGGIATGAFGALASPEDPAQGFVAGFAPGAILGSGVGALGQWGYVSNPLARRAEMDAQVGAYKQILRARPDEAANFEKLSPSNQRALSTYVAVHPELKIRYIDDEGGVAGFFDKVTKTATVNLAAKAPLAEIIRHEVAHFVADKEIGGQVQTQLIGDAEARVPGEFTATDVDGMPILETVDGKKQYKVNAEFERLRGIYEERLKANGVTEKLSNADIADEIFAERHVDYLLSDKFYADVKGFTAFDAIDSVPFLKNALGRLGVHFDNDGGVIRSTLLGDFRKSPEIEKLISKYYEAQANAKAGDHNPDADGRNQVFDEKAITSSTKTAQAYFDASPELLRDTAGNPVYDKDGKAIIRKASDVKREVGEVATAAADAIAKETPENAEVVQKRNIDGSEILVGRYLSDGVIAAIEASGKLNPVQISQLRELNAALKAGGGQQFTHFYQAATKKGGGSLYRSLAGRWRTDLVYGVRVTKADNIAFQSISLEVLLRNAQIEVQKGRATAWDNDTGALVKDIDTYLTNLASGKSGADTLGIDKKNFINNLLGIRVKKNGDVNPLFEITNQPKTIITTLRLDRMNRVIPAEGRRIPFDANTYQAAAKNLRPDDVTQSNTERALRERGSGDRAEDMTKALVDSGQNNGDLSNNGRGGEKSTEGAVSEGGIKSDGSTLGSDYRKALVKAAAEHPAGAAVQIKDAEFYNDPSTRLFLAEDNSAGVAVGADGDLVSVFKAPGSRFNISDLLERAAPHATKLDAFDGGGGKLPNLYAEHDFRPAARVAFNKEFAPAGWPYERMGEPDVVLMVRDPEGVSGLPEIRGDYTKIKDTIPLVSYEEAVKLQEEAIARVKDGKRFRPDNTGKAVDRKNDRTDGARDGRDGPGLVGPRGRGADDADRAAQGGAARTATTPVQFGSKRLEHSVEEDVVNLVHYSSQGSLKVVNPDYLGKGVATANDRRGLNKSFFFVQGSPLAGDRFLVGGQGKTVYGARVNGGRIYDGNTDALGYWGIINREKADQMLVDAGYAGMMVTTPEKRQVVSLYEKAKVVALDSDPTRAKAATDVNFRPDDIETPEFKQWFAASKVVDEDGLPKRLFHTTTAADQLTRFKRTRKDIGFHFGTAAQAEDRFNLKIENDPYGPTLRGVSHGTVPVYLRIENPLRLPDLGSWNAENLIYALREKGAEFSSLRSGMTIAEVRESIIEAGYDGIVYANTGETSGAQEFRHRLQEARENLVSADWYRAKKWKNSFSVEEQTRPEYRAVAAAEEAYRNFRNANAEDSYIAFEPTQIKSAIGNNGKFSPQNPDIRFRPDDGGGGGVPDEGKLDPQEFLRRAVGDSAENLRMKQDKRPGTGVAKNAFREFTDAKGRPITIGADAAEGGKPFAAWVHENESWLNDNEIAIFRGWYSELHDKFTDIFGEKEAGVLMTAWLAAQQNISPGGALGNVFKVEDRLAGLGRGLKGGLADAKIEGILTHTVPEKGFGPKLSDFVDAGFLRSVRTFMGGKPEGGAPFVADVHTGRDSGHVDQQVLTRLVEKARSGDLFIEGKPAEVKVTRSKQIKVDDGVQEVPTRVWVKAEGIKPFGIEVDMTGSPGGTQYEGISEWGNALTSYLNANDWKGGKWTPSEVQAVGWMRILRQYGLPEASVATAIKQNTHRVYAEVNYSSGGSLPQSLPKFGSLPYDAQHAITKEVMETVVPELASIFGGSMRIRHIATGDGLFGGERAPSVAVSILGSADAADLFATSLAYVSEQAATMSVVFGVGGKDSRAVAFNKKGGGKFTQDELNSLFRDAKIAGFSVHQLPDGESALITDTRADFTPKGFSEKKVTGVVETLQKWADEKGVDLDIDNVAARITSYGNDWKAAPEGESYDQILKSRGIGEKIRGVRDFRGRYKAVLEQAFRRHSPGAEIPPKADPGINNPGTP